MNSKRSMAVTCHELKTWPQYYAAILDGRKTFEVRLDDRGFQAGDEVLLREWDQGKQHQFVMGDERLGYTGRQIRAKIGYVLHAVPAGRYSLGGPPVPGSVLGDHVVFSLCAVTVEDVEPPQPYLAQKQR